MILGDNIYYGNGFTPILKEAAENAKNGKATIDDSIKIGQVKLSLFRIKDIINPIQKEKTHGNKKSKAIFERI